MKEASAGTGTRAFGWKGGIGTSSRKVPAPVGGYTVGVLVQSNFGGVLQIMGAPVGQELGQKVSSNGTRANADGSIMMVVATDAPLSDRNLKRLASRALMGLARTGSVAGNGSGDYVIAFSTAPEVRRPYNAPRLTTTEMANTEQLSALYEAVIESTEEAIYNSLFRATTVSSKAATSKRDSDRSRCATFWRATELAEKKDAPWEGSIAPCQPPAPLPCFPATAARR